MANLELLVKQNAEAIQQLIDNAKEINELSLFEEEFQDDDLLIFWIASIGEAVSVPYSIFKAQIIATGSGDKNFIHEQGIPATTWLITHNLGKYPAVKTMDSSNREIIGAVSWPDLNTVQIDFNSGFSGKATLN